MNTFKEGIEQVKRASKILLHLHPNPDLDSVGSAFSCAYALASLGKQVQVLRGDSILPEEFKTLPGNEFLLDKRLDEIDLGQFDLFVVLDSGSPEMISKLSVPQFPLAIPTLVIDHHASNSGYGTFNIVDATKSSCAEMMYEFYTTADIKITGAMARLLFVGMHFDTGGFLYNLVTSRTLEIAAALIAIAPEAKQDVLSILGSEPREWTILKGLALADLMESADGRVAVGRVSHSAYTNAGITEEKLSTHVITNVLRSCKQWTVAVGLIEVLPGKIKISLRSKDAHYADVSLVAAALGGGGHILAAGATVTGKNLDEVTEAVLARISK